MPVISLEAMQNTRILPSPSPKSKYLLEYTKVLICNMPNLALRFNLIDWFPEHGLIFVPTTNEQVDYTKVKIRDSHRIAALGSDC
jgi:hypothetical protein